ncbi:MAG: flagellar biosynthesis anti-sigma factor FlgM [Lachnospiraceae bacterium]|nr:flagellar biosynthesis anti-sigma factor FlgM [Lachnospiraceae bacterium]
MRIDAYAQVQQLYSNKNVKKVQKETKTSFKDQLQISSKGKDIQTAKNAVANVADVREEVVEPLKKVVSAGNYEVSGGKFAQKLFEKYNNTHLEGF